MKPVLNILMGGFIERPKKPTVQPLSLIDYEDNRETLGLQLDQALKARISTLATIVEIKPLENKFIYEFFENGLRKTYEVKYKLSENEKVCEVYWDEAKQLFQKNHTLADNRRNQIEPLDYPFFD